MICVSNACRQHSGRCPTPWTCGGYATEAHHKAMHSPLHITMEPDEAAAKRKPDDAALWAVVAAIAIPAVLAVAAVAWQVWPLVMAVARLN